MSINVRGMANAATQNVNSNLTIDLLRSNGYTISPNGKQVPAFLTLSGAAQVQGLAAKDLQHMNNLNIQGVLRKVYLYGNWMGVVRSDSKGGDVLVFPQAPGMDDQQWKVVTVFETWADWCSVGVVLQVGTVAS
jgi:hypothetical protein